MINDNAVRGYTDKELLNRCKKTPGFVGFPKGYWLLFVRSEENLPNVFDDKVYMYKGTEFVMTTSCTTNAGATGLSNYERYNRKGTFVAKSDVWNYGLWKYGLHRSRMPALRQHRKITGFRDNNRNNQAEEIGNEVRGYYGINFHTVDYALRPSFWRRFIGGWSVGCFVVNNVSKYLQILEPLKNQESVSMCILKEF